MLFFVLLYLGGALFVAGTIMPFSSSLATISLQDFPCTTPNNEDAYCISIFSCPVLIKSIGSSDASTIQFVRNSLCGDCRDGDIKVCCGTVGKFQEVANSSVYSPTPSQVSVPFPANKINTTQESHRDFVIRKLLPTRTYCGLQHTDDRFYNGSKTALDEFPWLVQVKWYNVEDEGDYNERCNGVLISNRYVLTDYLCGFHGKKVKLGQHATSQAVSCVEDDPDFLECTDPVLEIDIEEKFRWAVPSRSGSYNFVLMRLTRRISYTDYVRPICLPLDEYIRGQEQKSLVFSGWGASDSKGISKKRLIYNVTDNHECYKVHNYLEGNVKSADVDLVCLAVQRNNTSQACNGDHGGPLMYSHRSQWFVKGILISVVADTPSDYCSNKHPVNGIAITPEIIEWILGNMRD